MSYCISPIIDYVPTDESCGQSTFPSGILDLVFFFGALPSNPSNPTEVQSLIDAGEAMYVPKVMATINAPEPVEVQRKQACAPVTVSTYNRTLTIHDDDVSAVNVEAWNSINASSGRQLTGILAHECAAHRATFIANTIALIGGRETDENDDGELQFFAFEARWKARFDSEIVEWPDGLTPAS